MMQIKSWVKALKVYEPGRPIEEVAREHGFPNADGIVKLASNENALGPSKRAMKALRDAAHTAHLYPDGGSFYLREALAKRLDVRPSQILIGHGSNEILALLGHAFLDPGTNLVMADGAFVVYRLVADLYQAATIAVPMRAFTHDLDAMLAAVTPQTRLLLVANPNNPTGTMVDGAAIDRLMARVPPHVAVVFDEAYIELLPPERQPDTLRYAREGRDVFILRTFSKTYGLAGLRIGYAVSTEEGIGALDRVRQPFNVNSLAQAAALAALEDEAHVVRTRRLVGSGLAQLQRAFRTLGLDFVPSVANFMLVKVGAGREVFEKLQRRKVIVRPMDGYGLPDYVRVTVGTRAENDFFLDQLRMVLAERTQP
jgi:histidinol-phosphate aminotransferase